MANQRRLHLQQYGISDARYDELKALCRQYDEYVRKIREIDGIKDPTEADRQIKEACLHKKEAIDRAIRITTEGEHNVRKALFENIVHDTSYKHLSVPMERKTFYAFRKAFFSNLNRCI